MAWRTSAARPERAPVCVSRFLLAKTTATARMTRKRQKNMKKEFNIRILVADDHYVVRMGVIAIINDEPDMEVVAEAANGAQAVELFKKHKPDLTLLDSRMPL